MIKHVTLLLFGPFFENYLHIFDVVWNKTHIHILHIISATLCGFSFLIILNSNDHGGQKKDVTLILLYFFVLKWMKFVLNWMEVCHASISMHVHNG